MVEFQTDDTPDNYAGPIDDERIEDPIIPMQELGTTVVEHGPRGEHILQNIESSIRKGASKMQLMWQTQSGSAIGGRPKAYGKDVRQAIREMLEVNQVELSASELPTSSNTNMSGFDMQGGTISEQKRLRDLQEVKDAIDFQVEVGGGGGVDIWSQEFVRNITDDNDVINKNKKYQFYDYSPEELEYEKNIDKAIKEGGSVDANARVDNTKYLYDDRTGKIISDIKKSSTLHMPEYMTADEVQKEYLSKEVIGKYDERKGGVITKDDYVDFEGKWVDPNNPSDNMRKIPRFDKESGEFKSKPIDWFTIRQMTEEYNKDRPKEEHKKPEEMAFDLQIDNKIMSTKGSALFHSRQYEEQVEEFQKITKLEEKYEERKEELNQIFKDDSEGLKYALEQEKQQIARQLGGEAQQGQLLKDPEQIFDNIKQRAQRNIRYTHEAAASADAQADELQTMKEHVKTPDKIAKENTMKSYAELGVYAMEKAKDPRAKRDVYVGPELGWPTAYGGHPEEFIEIIQGSRKKMVEDLTTPGNPYYRENIDKKEAEEIAKKHIRGDFDTSHLAMWYNHFKAEKPNESEEKRMKRFNKWFEEQAEKMAKEDVIGSIQVVDSVSGQHSHLPAGQGNFPIVDAVEKVKKHYDKLGKTIDIVSEGHEEEKFGEGRILTETWKAFGAPVSSYWSQPGMGGSWRGVQGGYFGATQPPTYIVGAYTPSNEWSLWSETPFE